MTIFRPVLQVFMVSLIAFLLHKCFLYFFGFAEKAGTFHYSLEFLYGFFFACSAAIVLVLSKVRQQNIDHVGYTFLLLTCIKMAVAYAVLYPILNHSAPDIGFEKANFFILFALFLTIETTITIRMLDKA